MKLTKPQAELLLELNAASEVAVWDGYPPAKKLVELGLAEWMHRRYGDTLRITPAGRAAIGDE